MRRLDDVVQRAGILAEEERAQWIRRWLLRDADRIEVELASVSDLCRAASPALMPLIVQQSGSKIVLTSTPASAGGVFR